MDTISPVATNGSSVVVNGMSSYAISSPKLVAWFFLQIAGSQVLMPILVATFLFSKARRDATLVSFCATFIPSGISACLLLYAGQATGPEPNKALCIAQAALVNPCPPMWALALLACIFHMWKSLDMDPGRREYSRTLKYCLILLPYVVFIVYAVATAILSAMHPKKVTRQRRYLYCMLQQSHLYGGFNATPITLFADYRDSQNSIVILTIVVCAVVIGLAAHLGYKLYSSWRYLRRAGRKANIVNVKLGFRLMIFMVYILIGAVFTVWSLFNRGLDTSARDLFMASLGILVFALFGTQRDLFQVWCFWRRPSPSTLEEYSERSPTGSPSEKYVGSAHSSEWETVNPYRFST
ncbi:hypothetical protein EVG20_g2344 [Dentipellis fragilis]|uniref:G-protein coupled receptors family 2 profile 2 domain-containing protein n=1 Tax=Dentipellis fragilis TaxID=205917 RepID=A0A4Y9Z719_9AGAM|nr:hypothetical protein EVG20_g2344 [Dentipellis fragilis]